MVPNSPTLCVLALPGCRGEEPEAAGAAAAGAYARARARATCSSRPRVPFGSARNAVTSVFVCSHRPHGAPPPFTAEGLSLTLYAPGTGCSSTERTLSRARSRTDSPRACCGCEPHAAQRSTSAATRDGDVGEPHAKCYHPCAIYA